MTKRTKPVVKSIETFWPDVQASIWKAKCKNNPLLDYQNHDLGHCTCRCTPIPNETFLRYTIKNRKHNKKSPKLDVVEAPVVGASVNEVQSSFGNSNLKLDFDIGDT